MDLPEYIPNAPATDWHEDIIRPSIDQTDDSPKAESVDNHVDVKETSAIEPPAPTEKNRTVPNVRAALESRTMPGVPGAHQSLENILLNEFERQEEFNYSLITKLDEHSRIGSSVLEDSRQIITLLKENKEMLQALKKDMEKVKQDTRQLKARGLLGDVCSITGTDDAITENIQFDRPVKSVCRVILVSETGPFQMITTCNRAIELLVYP